MGGHLAVSVSVLLAASLLAGPSLHSQSVSVQSRIENIDISRFPTVELQVSVTRSGSQQHVTVQNVRLEENGAPQRVEFFDCPEDSIRLSLAVLLDRSASMARIGDVPDPDSTKIREAKKAIGTFLDLLGSRDESALFSFTTQNFTLRHLFTVERDFTFDAAAVKRALVPIAATGGTRLWQAIIDAVDLLENRRGRRVLIVLTDGRNQFGESYHTPAIDRAVDAGIPVYTIGIGGDADVGALAGFAAATGGRFHFAPQPADLMEVFHSIAGTLLTDACVLRYTSDNPCLDGTRRDIELLLSGSGFGSAADSFYTVPFDLTPVTLSAQTPPRVIARDTLTVPMIVAEQFSMLTAVNFMMTLHYDVDLMRYMRINQLGTMSQGQTVAVREDAPGTLEIRADAFYPAMPTGTLFELVFSIFPRETAAIAGIDFLAAQMSSYCPMALSVKGGGLTVAECEDFIFIGDTTAFVLPGDGSIAEVPMRIAASLPAESALTARVVIDETGYPYEVVGAETRGTLSEGGGVVMQQLSPGRTEFLVTGISGDRDSILFFLRVRARETSRFSSWSALPITGVQLSTGCRINLTTDSGGNWGHLLVDGICEPALRRRSVPSMSNHPNPFSPETRISFQLQADTHVRLRVMDAHGRVVRTLLDARMQAGTYTHRFDARMLPAGDYLAVLEAGGEQLVRNMMLVK